MGVGSAVSEALLRRIAETTSGACELVSPRENMSEHIVRHFRRIDQPKAQSVRIKWPMEPIRQSPGEIETVYAGDTLHVFGWLRERPVEKVELVMTLEDGRTVTQEARLSTKLTDKDELFLALPRVAACARIATLDSGEALALAERYQLVTEQTSCILVFEREEEQKSGYIPALRKVPQMLAAGWGGMGSVQRDAMYSVPRDVMLSPASHTAENPGFRLSLPDAWPPVPASASPGDFDLRDDSASQDAGDFGQLISALNARYPEITSGQLDIEILADLLELGLDQEIADQLSVLVGDGRLEQAIVVAFLAALSESDYGKEFSRHVKRLIRSNEKRITLDVSLKKAVQNIVTHV